MNYVDEANRDSKKEDEGAGTTPKSGSESADESGASAEEAGGSETGTAETAEDPGKDKEK
jgi:hypothetical protein